MSKHVRNGNIILHRHSICSSVLVKKKSKGSPILYYSVRMYLVDMVEKHMYKAMVHVFLYKAHPYATHGMMR